METCPCSSQRIWRHGVGLPGNFEEKREAVRVKAVVVASPDGGTGLVPTGARYMLICYEEILNRGDHYFPTIPRGGSVQLRDSYSGSPPYSHLRGL